MIEKKSISIIIPNYNGEGLFREFLPYTLNSIKSSGLEYEIIVVDDCSTDDSVNFIETYYPDIKLVVNTKNQGFSFSCNRGIEIAKYGLIFLLNSDVKLTEGYFEPQLKYFQYDDTFGVMGRIIDMEGDGIQDVARMPKFNGFKMKSDFYYSEDAGDLVYTFYLSGANALIDAKKLKEIGGFNELFSPFYSEDLELSIRAWRLGWKCYYEHSAVCRHKLSASTNSYKTPQWVKRIYFRNRFYVHAIHLEGISLLLWFAQISLIDFIPKFFTGQFWMLKSYKDFLNNIKYIKQSRKQFKRTQELKNSERSLYDIVSIIKSDAEGKNIHKIASK